MKKLISLLALIAVGAHAATFPTDFGSVPNVQARANVTNIASVPLALQSGTSLDWSGITHEKRLFREITTDTTFTFANLPTSATNSVTLVLYLTNNGPAGVASVTFPATVQWPGTFGAPTILQLSNAVTRYEFEHMGGGRVFGYDQTRYTVLAAGAGASLISVANTTTVAVAMGSVASALTNAVIRVAVTGGAPLTVNTNNLVVTNGNVGIGTATPHVLLNLADVNSPAIRIQDSSSGTGVSDGSYWQMINDEMYLANQENGGLHLWTSGADRMTILSGGNVGIGTTTPRQKLEVAGGVLITNSGEGLRIGAGNANVTNILSGSASLNFPSTLAGTFSDLPITVTGVTSNGCHVSPSYPWQSMTGGGVFSFYNSNDTVFIRFANNNLTLAIDPDPGTFSALVFRTQ